MWNLIQKDFKEIGSKFHNKRWIFMLSIVSIILIIGTYCATREKNTEKTADMTIGVVDLDKSFYSKLLIGYFKENPSIKSFANIVEGTETEIEEMFQAGQLIGYLVLPNKFTENLISVENTPIRARISMSNTMIALVLKNMLESYEKYIAAVQINCVGLYDVMKESSVDRAILKSTNIQISKDLAFTVLGRNTIFQEVQKDGYTQVPLAYYYLQALVGILILYIGLYSGFQYLKEKENKILSRIRLSKISYLTYISEKVLFSTILFSIVFLTLYFIGCFSIGTFLETKVILIYIMSIFISSLLGILLALLCGRTTVFLLTSNFLYLCVAIVGGGIIPLMYLPSSFIKLSKFMPIYWFIKFQCG